MITYTRPTYSHPSFALLHVKCHSDIDGSGTEGVIEIRVFQGRQPNEVMVGETALPLQKLPVEGFDRKP